MPPENCNNIVETMKAAVEVGGPKEIQALNTQLNSMSYQDLQQLSHAIPCFNAMEQSQHPGLPQLELGGHGGGAPGVESRGFTMATVGSDGSEKTLYNRDFQIDHGVATDIKYNPGTDVVASKTVIPSEPLKQAFDGRT